MENITTEDRGGFPEKKKRKSIKLPTMDELALEGESLLSTKTPVKEPTPIQNLQNPYLIARNQVLKKLPTWRSKEILTMEKAKNTSNSHYEEFVRMVIELGDSLSK